MKRIDTLIIGASTDGVKSLEVELKNLPQFDVSSDYSAIKGNSVVDKISTNQADLVVLSVNGNWKEVLQEVPKALSDESALIVYGPDENMPAMRMAMKIGAKDYLSDSFSMDELRDTVINVGGQISLNKEAQGQLVSIVNAKGGSGGSFIATNLAYIFAVKENLRTALLDFDFQYGVQGLSLDMEVKHGIEELVNNVGKVDPDAIKGYMDKHESGLFLLGEKQDHIILPGDLDPKNVDKMIDVQVQAFDQIVIDLPRAVDPIFLDVVSRSDQVLLVMQQTVAHVRDIKRLHSILVKELDIAPGRVTIVVNRYSENNSVTLDAIKETTGCRNIVTLSNDYKRVALSTDMATPMCEYAPTAPLTKELFKLSNTLRGINGGKNRGVFGRVIGGLFGR